MAKKCWLRIVEPPRRRAVGFSAAVTPSPAPSLIRVGRGGLADGHSRTRVAAWHRVAVLSLIVARAVCVCCLLPAHSLPPFFFCLDSHTESDNGETKLPTMKRKLKRVAVLLILFIAVTNLLYLSFNPAADDGAPEPNNLRHREPPQWTTQHLLTSHAVLWTRGAGGSI
ncbi:hypothetical protein TcBrA4_0120820 [Trypanosoma cruzi]|nr:hypothetical protein TcBrA4_0120820 [Trypanosoma cruzi]